MKTNAFSLIEMLTVLIIMGVISIIGVIAFQNFAAENKASLNSNLEKTIIDATEAYCTKPEHEVYCGTYYDFLGSDQDEMSIKLSTLVNAKLLDGDLKNYVTNKPFCLTETVVTVEPTSEYNYKYTFLIAGADYSCNP